MVATVIYLLRRRGNWLSGAGWSTLALVASLAWLVPWYVIWVLPLAALGTSVRLRRAAVVFSIYVLLAFIPATSMFLAAHGINPMGGSVGTGLQGPSEEALAVTPSGQLRVRSVRPTGAP